MKFRLLSFALLTLAIAACKNTSPETSDEIIRIGTWDINLTKLQADWIGSQQKKNKTLSTLQAGGDTLFFDTPDGNGFKIWKPEHFEEDGNLNIVYVDSTFNQQVFDTTDASPEVLVTGPFWESGEPGIWLSGMDAVSWMANAPFAFHCDSTYSFDIENVEFTMLDDDEEFFKAFHFNTQGIIEASRFIACSDSI